MSDTTTKEVTRTLKSNLDTVETQDTDLGSGVRATVSESEAGDFFRTLRIEGYDFNSRRLGDTIVAHIEAEEQSSLATLFG